MFSPEHILTIIILALAFDFINGFHDTANSIATSVYTRALTPGRAVMMAALLNFLGAVSSTAVAATIAQGIAHPLSFNGYTLIAALIAAIMWNLFTWYLGMPSSSSHALIGGLVGSLIAGWGAQTIIWQGFFFVLAGLIISPLVGFMLGHIIMKIFLLIFRNTNPVGINNQFRKAQIVSAGLASFAHGCNDAQKSMGLITLTLVASGWLSEFSVPLWVKISCAAAMALGTWAGGWKIVRTLGNKIIRLEPINGFASDLASSLVVYSASLLGAPVSTTHVVSSSLLGMGAAVRSRGVRWKTGVQMVEAWFMTIPITAILSAAIYCLLKIIV
ncbi:MAG: inorganic phosphate transporter [Syntrophomonadaceae bacterium]|jgi:PiT family inorganic phosphate transporter